MNKDLPGVFANKIDNAIDNVQSVFYGEGKDDRNVNEVLDKIYSNSKFAFLKSVEIVTNTEKSVEKIAARFKDHILTLSNKNIKIADIKSIKEIK